MNAITDLVVGFLNVIILPNLSQPNSMLVENKYDSFIRMLTSQSM